MAETVVALGSNLGDRRKNIESAISSIDLLPETGVADISKMYETQPFQVPNKQNNYLNCCAKVFTELAPQIFLGSLLGIEAAMGRKRNFKFSERIIDLDLIFYGNEHINQKNIVVPHPRAMERAFVLAPLRDLYPNMQFQNIDFSKNYKNCNKSILINLQ